MEIPLNLTHHCVETACKKLYNLSVSQYFKPNADITELEDRIAILKTALKTFDFSDLRKKYSELNGKSNTNILLFYHDAGEIGLKIDGSTVLSRPCRIDYE